MQAADETTTLGRIFTALDTLVDSSLRAIATVITIKSFTRSGLIFGFMIGYVYLACWVLIVIVRTILRRIVDLMGRHNVLWLRNVIARERGAQAYQAWLPLERIRPADVPQQAWEQQFAWPANDASPFPPLGKRIARGVAAYTLVAAVVAVSLQLFTPLPVLSWMAGGIRRLTGA
jgi:hypothetical protein